MGVAISGVYSAAATPLDAELNPDVGRLAAHCRGLIAAGCDGVAVLGTTGEANSFSVRQRQAIVEGLLRAGLSPEQLAPGVGVAATDVTVELGPSGELARAVPVGRNRRRTGSSRSLGPGLFPETMALMGSRWSSATLGAAFLGASRFRDFEAALGAPPNVVSERLRQFVELDVLRSDEAEGYVLTDKGRDFFPAVTQLVAWGERWHPAAEGPALVATHACGNGFVPQLRCDRCGASLNRATVAVERSRTQQRKSS